MLKTLFDTFSFYVYGESEQIEAPQPQKQLRPKLKAGAFKTINQDNKKRVSMNQQEQNINPNIKFSLGVPDKSPNRTLRKRAVRNYIENEKSINTTPRERYLTSNPEETKLEKSIVLT